MNVLIALLAATSGYLLGSISFARIVTWLVTRGGWKNVRLVTPDGSTEFQSDAVSATAVRARLGAKFGCLTAIFDILKASVPALIFKSLYSDQPYYLIAAAMATVGHNWPIYYRFKGGRGMSPIIGGMLVIDWLGVLITNAVGTAAGYLLKDLAVLINTGIALMIPWVWFRHRDVAQLIYVIAMNILFWMSMMPENRQYFKLKREGKLKTLKDMRQFMRFEDPE